MRLHNSIAHSVLPNRPLPQLLLLATLIAGPLAALAAALPAQSADLPSVHISMQERGRPALSYALVRQHDTVLFVGNHKELTEATRHKSAAVGDFLWVRKGQQRYLLDDPAILADLLALWQQVTPFEQQLQQLEAQMREHTDQLEARVALLEAALAEDETDYAAIRAFEREQEPLEQKIEPLGAEMSRIGGQIESLSAVAHEQTLLAIEAAIVSGKARALAAP